MLQYPVSANTCLQGSPDRGPPHSILNNILQDNAYKQEPCQDGGPYERKGVDEARLAHAIANTSASGIGS